MTDIRHIVFDLGRVLVRWEPELPFLRLIPDNAAREKFLAEICNGGWLLETDRGSTWADAERVLVARHPEHEAMILAFRKHWREMVPGLVEGTPDILAALIAAGYDVTALTNFATDTFDEAYERFPVLGSFRGITVSARCGIAKPDAGIFERHAADFALAPPGTLFFDDSPANVDAARKAGWNAEVFIDAVGMRRDLKRYGVGI